MLLVDHYEADACERLLLVQQGVGTNQGLGRLAAFDLSRQQIDGDSEPLKPGAEVAEMLFGENLGRCHQDGAMARFDRDQHGCRCDNGLT